jgi:prepilin-type N-terminal cleavage/methylation domain-containing protein
MKNLHKKAFSLIEISVVIVIIGILIAGVSQGIDLYQDMRLATARALTQSSRVNRIEDLAIWLESTSEKSFDKSEMIDRSLITKWYDINPKNTQSNYVFSIGNNRPKYLKSCPENNLPCLEFSSANSQYLESLNSIAETTDLSIFFVINFKAINSLCCTAILTSVGTWQPKEIHINITENNFQYAIKTSPINDFDFRSVSNPLNKKLYMIETIDGDILRAYFNGVQQGLVATNYVKKIGNFNIGRWSNGSTPSRYLDAYIHEIIIFRKKLNEIERKDIETYLSKKWSIKIN